MPGAVVFFLSMLQPILHVILAIAHLSQFTLQ